MEQHPKQQGHARLGYRKKGKEYFCCLGIGGLLAKTCSWTGDILYTRFSRFSGILDDSSVKALGLRDGLGYPNDYQFKSLTRLNDGGNGIKAYTWPEIAAILRAHPEKYFEHSV